MSIAISVLLLFSCNLVCFWGVFNFFDRFGGQITVSDVSHALPLVLYGSFFTLSA